MQMKELKKQILRAVRGKRSQTQLSRIMKFRFNQIYRWENDITRIHWIEFVQLCEACKVNIKGILAKSLTYSDDPRRGDLLLRHLVGTQNITKIAAEANMSRFVFSDWIKGKSEITLEGILQILERRDLLLAFLKDFPNSEKISELQEKAATKERALQYFCDHPLATAVLISLELSGYRSLKSHSSQFLGKKLGISEAKVDQMLEQMKKLRLIEEVQSKYQQVDAFFDTKSDFEKEKKLRKFWVERGLGADLARTQRSERNHFGYLVLSVNDQKRAQIMKAYDQFRASLLSIASDEKSDNSDLLAFTVQIFDVGQ